MKSKRVILRCRQAGLSVVELMVSLAIGLLLMLGALNVFLASTTSYTAHDQALRVQENIRFAQYFLAKDIRSAGYLGCTSLVPFIEWNGEIEDKPANLDPILGLQGWDALGTTPGDAVTLDTGAPADSSRGWASNGGVALESSIKAMAGTDIIQIWRGESAGGITGLQAKALNDETIQLSKAHAFAEGDFILLTDCKQVFLRRVCAIEASTETASNLTVKSSCGAGSSEGGGTASGAGIASTGEGAGASGGANEDLSSLGEPAYVLKLASYIYYIGKRANDASNPPALFRKSVLGSDGPEELVEGIESMQILYGVDTNADRKADSYVPAASVSNWSDVVSVRLALLLATEDGVLKEAQSGTVDLLGVKVSHGEDKRLRRVMTTNIALRNRAL